MHFRGPLCARWARPHKNRASRHYELPAPHVTLSSTMTKPKISYDLAQVARALLRCKGSSRARSVAGQEETKTAPTSWAFPMSLLTVRPAVLNVVLWAAPSLATEDC